MKLKFFKLAFSLFILVFLVACATSSTKKVSFGNNIVYELFFDVKEIRKSGDFLVLVGKNNERLVIAENFLDDVLAQITPPIDGIAFFDLVYRESDLGVKIPTQVLDFKNGFLEEKYISKYKELKDNSVIYIWEFVNNRFKAIEIEKGKNYFLTIYAENYSKDTFLVK